MSQADVQYIYRTIYILLMSILVDYYTNLHTLYVYLVFYLSKFDTQIVITNILMFTAICKYLTN